MYHTLIALIAVRYLHAFILYLFELLEVKFVIIYYAQDLSLI